VAAARLWAGRAVARIDYNQMIPGSAGACRAPSFMKPGHEGKTTTTRSAGRTHCSYPSRPPYPTGLSYGAAARSAAIGAAAVKA
jgi:hypothetical protein